MVRAISSRLRANPPTPRHPRLETRNGGCRTPSSKAAAHPPRRPRSWRKSSGCWRTSVTGAGLTRELCRSPASPSPALRGVATANLSGLRPTGRCGRRPAAAGPTARFARWACSLGSHARRRSRTRRYARGCWFSSVGAPGAGTELLVIDGCHWLHARRTIWALCDVHLSPTDAPCGGPDVGVGPDKCSWFAAGGVANSCCDGSASRVPACGRLARVSTCDHNQHVADDSIGQQVWESPQWDTP